MLWPFFVLVVGVGPKIVYPHFITLFKAQSFPSCDGNFGVCFMFEQTQIHVDTWNPVPFPISN
jgi:hypothetical protein